jgi:hypothetical protein
MNDAPKHVRDRARRYRSIGSVCGRRKPVAMTSAAAASPRATAGPKAAARAATAISGDWEGSYTCGSAATGLDLTIQSSGTTNALKATFTFYPLPSNTPPVGVYDMTGTYHSASRIVLNFSRWIHQPPGYEPVGLVGALSGASSAGRSPAALLSRSRSRRAIRPGLLSPVPGRARPSVARRARPG